MSTNRLSPARKKRYYKREYFKEIKEIVSLLNDNSKDKINVNEIVRIIEEKYKGKKRTGLKNKPNIINAIEKLKEAGLVKKEKQGKQKELVVLTDLGEEIAKFITAIERYNLSYFNLLKTIHEKVSFVLGRDLPYIEKDDDELNQLNLDRAFKEEVSNMRINLIEKGWKKEEIKFYNTIQNTLIDLKIICDNNFINILISRYSRIMKKHDEENPLLLGFLNYLVKESVTKKIDFMLINYQSEIFGYSTFRVRDSKVLEPAIVIENTGSIYEYFSSLYYRLYDQMIPSIMEKEVQSMLSSYIELLRLSYVMHEIWYLKKLIERYDTSLNNTEQKLSNIQITKIEIKRRTANMLFIVLSKYYSFA